MIIQLFSILWIIALTIGTASYYTTSKDWSSILVVGVVSGALILLQAQSLINEVQAKPKEEKESPKEKVI